MKTIVLFLMTLTACGVWGVGLVVGDFGHGAELAHTEIVKYRGIPFVKREKFYFYTQRDNRKIRGIQIVDNVQGKSTIDITAGGVGYSFVNFRIESERGRRMNWSVGIYVEPYTYQGPVDRNQSLGVYHYNNNFDVRKK